MARVSVVRTANQLNPLLTQASASATYLSKVSASSTYLTQTSASSLYLTQSSALSEYLPQSSASSLYLTQTSASNIYPTKGSVELEFLSKSSASSAYLTQASASTTYLSKASASTTYLTETSASTIYATKANFPEGEWTQFSLTTTNISFGSGASILSFYTKVGKTVFGRIFLQLGSGGSFSGNPTFSLPVTPRLSYINPLNGISYSLTQNIVGNSLCSNGVGGSFPGSVYINNSGSATCTVQNTAGTYSQDVSLSSTVPFTWSSFHTIYLEFCYESV